MTKPKVKWGDARIAFRIIAPRVEEALRSGRSVRSVYEEMRAHFPAGYEQFAKYARESGARTRVRRTTGAPFGHVPPNCGDGQRNRGGPLEIVLGPPARFKHDPRPDSSDDLI